MSRHNPNDHKAIRIIILLTINGCKSEYQRRFGPLSFWNSIKPIPGLNDPWPWELDRGRIFICGYEKIAFHQNQTQTQRWL